ncbi:hypothetical protein GRX03_15920 [Halovenus sp. WSH3]|uniref:DUF6199 domain-containing protein n=1 Tax=Halovenus carboxidivorans TaxID=2692199 RepID=A0A6B0T4M8_9EURY|nr:hypothetical protein [Halovenus carboxidivorans]MXR53085.1 hypothetical protein [Halovenus carboxidivorans]
MVRPLPLQRVLGLCLCLSVLAIASLSVVPTAGATTTPANAQVDPCLSDSYDPELSEPDWETEFTDPIENGSLANWDGGRLARVGSDRGCSLAVLDEESTQLTAANVSVGHDVVTGRLDLGSNGTFELVEAGTGASNGTATESGANATVLRISNTGPDYSNTVAVSAGNASENVTLTTGRFFGFAAIRDNGTVRVKLWRAGDDPPGDWDLTAENATTDGQLMLRMDGRAFLDAVAIGAVEPQTPPDSGEDGEEDPFGSESPSDSLPEVPDDTTTPTYTTETDGTAGRFIFGLFLIVVGGIDVAYARPLARFGEQIDAIGSTRSWSEVEPAEWKVWLTKVGGGVAIFVGVVLVLVAVL